MAHDVTNQGPLAEGSAYRSVEAAVCGFGAFRKRWAVLEGLAGFVVLGPGCLLLWFLFDWLVGLPPWPLLGSFLVAILVGLWAAGWKLARPALRRIRVDDEALLIEALHGKLDTQLIASLQLGREAAEATGHLGHSVHLVHALMECTAGLLERLNTRALLDLRRARHWLGGAAAVAAATLACLVCAGDAVAARAARLRDAYAAILDALFPVTMVVYPGDIAVVRGRPVTVSVEVRGARRRQVRLVRRQTTEDRRRTTDDLALVEGKASLVVHKAEESFTYEFEYGGRRTPRHTVLVGDLPAVSAIHYELSYPAYTGQPPRTLVGPVSRLQGLAGTEVLVSFAATTELHPDHCYVAWQDGSKQAISISGRFGHFSFTLDHPDRAAIHLTGAYGPGFEMERPIGFEVAVRRDQPPTVEILRRDRKLAMLAKEAAAFALRWVAEDDFGVAEVTLDYKVDGVDPLLGRPVRQGSQSRRIDPPLDRVRGQFAEALQALSPPLEPGDRVTLTVSARDNNTESGPGVGHSQSVQIVVVREDLAGFIEKRFGFEAQALLGGLHKIKRATDLLVDPVKTIRTEAKHDIVRHELRSRVTHETWPSGAEDAVGDYFRLLSGTE